MEAHASLPESEYIERMGEKIGKIIEEDISKTSSSDYSYEDIEEETIHISPPYISESLHVFVTYDESYSVHKSIPRRGDVQSEE